jgi:hypothetical protein
MKIQGQHVLAALLIRTEQIFQIFLSKMLKCSGSEWPVDSCINMDESFFKKRQK